MKSILEVETGVDKELRFGDLIHQPIVAWAFDTSRTRPEPQPVAVGSYARFLENRDGIQLVPANPGFFQMYYIVRRSRELLQRLTAEQRAEIRQAAGAFDLGVWTPEDATDWREVAMTCEQTIFEDLAPVLGNSLDELCDAADSNCVSA